MKSKKSLSCFALILFAMINFTSVQAQTNPDWPNLKKYQEANKSVPEKNESEDRVVFMGDSITEFWVINRPNFFKTNPYIGRGISGQTTPQMLVRFKQDVVHLDPDVVVILAGINDIAGNTGPSTIDMIVDNITSMIEVARANQIKVLLCSVLPANDFPWSPGLQPGPKVVALNELLKTYANEHNIEYVDYYSPMVDNKLGLQADYGDDGVHPNQKGYAVMEPIIKKAIDKILAR